MNRKVFNNKSDNDVSKQSIDEFRRNEVTIEQEYERREKENENSDESQPHADPDLEEIKKIRCSILDASLGMVPKHGWTREAIVKGAELIDYPGVIHGLFPNGGYELIQHFYTVCNKDLVRFLQEELENGENKDKTNGPKQDHSPAEFAKKVIRRRLEMIIPYLDSWPQALATMSLPQHVPTSLAQLLTLIDDICYYAGDRSVDVSQYDFIYFSGTFFFCVVTNIFYISQMGWYTRRVGLAAIYKMTELHLIQDKSPNYEETWKFLDRRIEDAIHIQGVLSISDQATTNMSNALGSAFTTVIFSFFFHFFNQLDN